MSYLWLRVSPGTLGTRCSAVTPQPTGCARRPTYDRLRRAQFRPHVSFGEDVAAAYDEQPRGDEEEAVACLAELELDLMARIAGLRRHARWGGAQPEVFDSRSTRPVSVYGR